MKAKFKKGQMSPFKTKQQAQDQQMVLTALQLEKSKMKQTLYKLQTFTHSLEDVVTITGMSEKAIKLIIKQEAIVPLWFHGHAYFYEYDVETIYTYIASEE